MYLGYVAFPRPPRVPEEASMRAFSHDVTAQALADQKRQTKTNPCPGLHLVDLAKRICHFSMQLFGNLAAEKRFSFLFSLATPWPIHSLLNQCFLPLDP